MGEYSLKKQKKHDKSPITIVLTCESMCQFKRLAWPGAVVNVCQMFLNFLVFTINRILFFAVSGRSRGDGAHVSLTKKMEGTRTRKRNENQGRVASLVH